MKPKYLEFCGINSFSEPAKIDFEKLLRGGIFGIFGDTGSGKTTILDSIVFALYGRIDRASGVNGSEIIHYGCDRAYVYFEFETAGDSGRKLYRIEREMRRKKSAQKAELILIEGDKKTSIGDGKVSAVNALVQEIVGLSFDDFKKCIALPQGEFARFVKDNMSDRLKLVARLFGLEEYGERLNAGVREKMEEYKGLVSERTGRISSYQGVTEEAANELKRSIESLAAEKGGAEKEAKGAEERYNFLKNAYEKGLLAAETERRLHALREKESDISDKKRAIGRYAAALAAKNAGENARELRFKIESANEKREKFVRAAESAATSAREAEEKFSKANCDGRLTDLRAKLAKAEYLEKDEEDLQNKLAEIEALKREYKKIASESESAGHASALLQEEKTRLAQRIKEAEALGSPEALLEQKFGGALLRGEYGRALRFFEEKRELLEKNFPAEGELYFAVENALAERIEHYAALFAKIEETGTPDEIFDRFKNLRDSREALTKEEHSLQLKESENEQKRAICNDKLSEFSEKGKKLAAEAADLRRGIDSVTGGGVSYNDFTDKLQKDISELEGIKREYAATAERLKKAESDAQTAVKECEAAIKSYSESLADYEGKLAESLHAGAFGEEGAARRLLEKYPNIRLVEEEVERYTEERLSLEGKRSAYAEGLPAVTEEELKSAKSEKEVCSRRCLKINENLVLAESKFQEITEKLTEKKEIEKELKYYRGKLEIAEQLHGLVKSNQFMEFIASEYLADISAAASETLLKLSGGRYFIRYRQGFFAGDNFNGGEQRPVSTLSGGETFLVSLSLALSLSSAIYAKSLRPIEFFFLDEGFGTLDEKLVDTVMDSLEKLKNTHFSIGLISHVEELKHRIENKIVVLGANEGGSSKIQNNY